MVAKRQTLFQSWGKKTPDKQPLLTVKEKNNIYDHTKRKMAYKKRLGGGVSLGEFVQLSQTCTDSRSVNDSTSTTGRVRDREKPKLFCTWCQQYPGTADPTFTTTGCVNIQHSSLSTPEKSKKHRQIASWVKAKTVDVGQSMAEETLQKMNQAQFKKLCIQFHTAHALAKKARPFADFVWMCDLDQAKSVDIGNTYRSDKQLHTLCHYIAEVERLKLQELISKV